MVTNQLEVLAQFVFPSEILNYFSVTGVEQISTEIHIHLEEQMNPTLSNDAYFESKGFMKTVSVTDFPIHDHKIASVAGPIRAQARVSVSLLTLMTFVKIPVTPRNLVFFLKETYGNVPSDLPYA
jgi:hypothetical protein